MRRIAELAGDKASVCALTRAVEKDIDAAADALRYAKRPRIHTGLGVSPSHLRDKLRMTEEECLERAAHCVAYAKRFCDDVQFYAEDAGRSDYDFLVRVIQCAVDNGATVVNIPDTTGYSMPDEFGRRIKYLMDSVRRHRERHVGGALPQRPGHGDGARAWRACSNGATQVECTINGLGERAGNTAMEEVVMAIQHARGRAGRAHRHQHARVHEGEPSRARSITGMGVQANKAIVGANAFAHSSGIHQDGVLKKRDTYEIIDPAEVGAGSKPDRADGAQRPCGARSTAWRSWATSWRAGTLDEVYEAFLNLADKKKEVYDEDLESLVNERDRNVSAHVHAGGRADQLRLPPHADGDGDAAERRPTRW